MRQNHVSSFYSFRSPAQHAREIPASHPGSLRKTPPHLRRTDRLKDCPSHLKVFNRPMNLPKWICLLFFGALPLRADELPPGASPLTTPGDLSTQMVAGVDRFLQKQTEVYKAGRDKYWKRDFSSPAAYEESIATNRHELRRITGVLEPRVPFQALEFVSSSIQPSKIAETATYEIQLIRWPVLDGVSGEGLWLRQKSKPKASVIALPDADQTPEMLCGLELGLNPETQFARRLADSGCDVFVPVLINRSDTFSGNAELNRFTN